MNEATQALFDVMGEFLVSVYAGMEHEEVVRRMIVADTAYVNNHPDGLLPLPNGVTINVKDIDHNALATAILAGE